jgi:hypothetical protein
MNDGANYDFIIIGTGRAQVRALPVKAIHG